MNKDLPKRLVIAVLLTLGACTKDPVAVSQSDNTNFAVETLFTHDGCTVYRFYDGGEHRYYTRCSATTTTASSHTEVCGKNCVHTVNESITTENTK